MNDAELFLIVGLTIPFIGMLIVNLILQAKVTKLESKIRADKWGDEYH